MSAQRNRKTNPHPAENRGLIEPGGIPSEYLGGHAGPPYQIAVGRRCAAAPILLEPHPFSIAHLKTARNTLNRKRGIARYRTLLHLCISEVIMPKRGKKNAQEAEREKSKKFVALRRQHSAVESQINALEHHGLDRCLDVGLEGYLRYVGYGVLAYNLHVIGRKLLERGSCLAAAA